MIRCVHCKGLVHRSRDTDTVLSGLNRAQIRTLDPEPADRRWLLAVYALAAALELGGYCTSCVLEQQVQMLGMPRPKNETRAYYKPRLQVVEP